MGQQQDPRALSGRQRLVPRRGRPAGRPTTLADPRKAKPATVDPRLGPAGRRAAIVLAALGIFWVATTAAGDAWGWPTRARALFDLIALAGFGVALYLTWQVWRLRRADRG